VGVGYDVHLGAESGRGSLGTQLTKGSKEKLNRRKQRIGVGFGGKLARAGYRLTALTTESPQPPDSPLCSLCYLLCKNVLRSLPAKTRVSRMSPGPSQQSDPQITFASFATFCSNVLRPLPVKTRVSRNGPLDRPNNLTPESPSLPLLPSVQNVLRPLPAKTRVSRMAPGPSQQSDPESPSLPLLPSVQNVLRPLPVKTRVSRMAPLTVPTT
jgi:hypothetical protein